MLGNVHVAIYVPVEFNADLPSSYLSDALSQGLDRWEREEVDLKPFNPKNNQGNTTRAIQPKVLRRLFNLCPEEMTFNEFVSALLWLALR